MGKKGPLQVAEAGNLGGGMSSCLGGCGGYSAFRSAKAWVLEELLLRLQLNLRRKEVPNDGVSVSTGLEE